MDALDNPDNHTALNQTSIIPITSSGKPIEYDGNPAHLAGVLHEREQFLIRWPERTSRPMEISLADALESTAV